jgi:hypothetical protein
MTKSSAGIVQTSLAKNVGVTLGETRGCRASAQCLSLNQEKEVMMPNNKLY